MFNLPPDFSAIDRRDAEQRPSPAARRGWFLLSAVCLVVALAVGRGLVAQDEDADDEDVDVEAKVQIHEWSFWIADPTLEQANQVVHFGSQMPGVVETDRSRSSGAPKFKPLGYITVHGQDCKEFELDMRLQGGRFVGHWPVAETKKGSRLRWIEMTLSAARPAGTRFTDIDSKHWFNRAREGDGLFLSHGGKGERFFAYDCEVAYSAPLRLTGGPDVYRAVNLMPYPLHDVLISLPTPEGRRVGRLAFLPAASPGAPGAAPAAAAPAQPPAAVPPRVDLPKKAAARRRAVRAINVAFRQQGKEDAKAAPPAPAAPANAPAPATEPAATEGVEIVMSPPFKVDAPEMAAARQALVDDLLKTGLTAAEVELFASLYAEPVLTSDQMVALVRLPSGILEEKVPIVAYPTPTRSIRVPLVLVRNVDPKIKEEIVQLVAQLGADDCVQRDAAEKRLLELARLAVPAVKVARKSSTDLEVVFRAERILTKQNESIDD